MLEAVLLYYAATRQPVWVCDEKRAAWFGQVALVLPGAVVLRVDNAGSPYHAAIPIARIRSIRERFPDLDVRTLDALFDRPDSPDGAPVHP